jgi:hypothetical protein
MRREYLPKKRPSEKFPLEWDFVDELALVPGDVITAYQVRVFDGQGNDVTATILNSAAQFGSVIQAWVKAGLSGSDYFVRYEVDTASGAHYENDIHVQVKAYA